MSLAVPQSTSTAYTFGIDSYYDGACARSYDPYEHAELLGLPVVIRELPNPEWTACYSEVHRAIFVRPHLNGSVERCAIAHEIAHFENGDVGCDRAAERRADRIAARRLIRPSILHRLAEDTDDLAVFALGLSVTEHIMAVFLRDVAGVA